MLFVHKGNANDTLLVSVYGQEHFYNFAQNKQGSLFVSSNLGLYQIDGHTLKRVGDQSGYIQFVDEEIVTSINLGIATDFKYKNLLPRLYDKYERQSSEIDNYIYIISKGTLFIFNVAEYSTKMKGASVRCFTQNSIGSYQGVYCFGEKIELPSYTSGYICEEDSAFFICYDGLAVYKKGKETKFYVRELTGETQINGKAVGFARDIRPLNNGSYVFSSTKGLYVISDSLKQVHLIKNSDVNEAPVIVDVVTDAYNNTVTFALSNQLFRYSFNDNELVPILKVKDPILDGKPKTQKNATSFLILTDQSVIEYDFFKASKKIINGIRGAHTITELNENEVLLTSNDGAYYVNLTTEKATKILSGVEFNRRASWKKDNVLKLGTTDGYIEVSIAQLKRLSDEAVKIEKSTIQPYLKYIIPGFVLIVIALLAYTRISKNYTHKNEREPISRIDVERYISENLAQVTLDSITSHFNISYKAIYAIVKPYKPGKLISKQRQIKAEELKLRGESIAVISKLTGFSVSYLKKMKI